MSAKEQLAAEIRSGAREVAGTLRATSARAALVARWERGSNGSVQRALESATRGEIPVGATSDTIGILKLRAHNALLDAMWKICEAGTVGDEERAGLRNAVREASARWWAATEAALTQGETTRRLLEGVAQVKRQIAAMDGGAERWWWTIEGAHVERARALDARAWRALEAAPAWVGARVLARDPGRAGEGDWGDWALEEVMRAHGHRTGPVPGAQAVRDALAHWQWSGVEPPLAIVRALALEGECLEGAAEWGAACEMNEAWTRRAGWTGTARRVRARGAKIGADIEAGIARLAQAKTTHCGCADTDTLARARTAWGQAPETAALGHEPAQLEVEWGRRTMVWRAAYTDIARVLAGLDGDCTAHEVGREMRENEALLIPAECRAPNALVVSGKASATDVAAQARRGEAVRAIAKEMME